MSDGDRHNSITDLAERTIDRTAGQRADEAVDLSDLDRTGPLYDPDEVKDDEEPSRPFVESPRRQTLTARIGQLVEGARLRQHQSQRAVAQRSGVSQGAVSRLERGDRQVSTALVESVLHALELQLRVEIEPLGTDLDAEIDRYRDLPAEELAAEVERHRFLWRKLSGLRYAVSGRLGAFVQGAPLSIRTIDLAVLREDLDGFALVFAREVCRRWSDTWNDYGHWTVDPREPGPMRWSFALEEIQLEVHDVPFRTIDLPLGGENLGEENLGGENLKLRPLPDIEAQHPDVARVLRRARTMGAAQ